MAHDAEKTAVFQGCVIAVAVVGALANGLLCFLLVQLERKKPGSTNLLILNQMSLDCLTCTALVVIYSLKFSKFYMEGLAGYLLCQLVFSEVIIWIGLNGSVAGIVVITLERYFKIVHPVAHKNHFRKWMIYAGAAASWLNGFLVTAPASWSTTNVIFGQCYGSAFWPSVTSRKAFGVWVFVWIFLLPLLIFAYCYGSILAVIRRRAKISALASGSGNAATAAGSLSMSAHRTQTNVVKTMIIIIVFYAMTSCSNECYFLFVNFQFNLNLNQNVYSATLFMLFLHVCGNPFIYASQYNVIKSRLDVLLKRQSPTTVQPIHIITVSGFQASAEQNQVQNTSA